MTMNFAIDIFVDSANIDEMLEFSSKPYVKGFTTNPTLMKKAKVNDYILFIKEVCEYLNDYSISFEVISDDFNSMYEEAKEISSCGQNIFVKIPIVDSKGNYSTHIIKKLQQEGVNVNVTAILFSKQIEVIVEALQSKNYVSIFAGRIADLGIDPIPEIINAIKLVRKFSLETKVIWASTREIFNIVQASKCACDIITVTPDILKKAEQLIGTDPFDYSIKTVKQFEDDARSCGYSLINKNKVLEQ